MAPPVKPATRTCGTAETHAHAPPVGPLAHPVHASPQRPPQHLTRSDQRGRRTRTHREHRRPREQRARTHIRSAIHARLVRPGGKTGEEPRRSTAPARNIQGAQPRQSTAPAWNLHALPHRAGRELVSRAPRMFCPTTSGRALVLFAATIQQRSPCSATMCRCVPAERRHALAQLCPVVRCCGKAAAAMPLSYLASRTLHPPVRGVLLCAVSSSVRFLLRAASSCARHPPVRASSCARHPPRAASGGRPGGM